MIGGQTKTPTMSVLFERKVDYVGGAAIVAKHLAAAGAEVTFSTVLGDDPLPGLRPRRSAKPPASKCDAVIDRTRPTTNKNAIIVGGYRLLKVDTLDNRSISDRIVDEITRAVRKVPADAVVFRDFRHGIFNRRTIPELVQALPAGCFRVADSQVASRWGNILEFQGFDLITPNEREARFALGDQDSGVRPLASNFLRRVPLQDADPQARRARHARLPQLRPRVADTSSPSTASPTEWSMRSAPAMRLLAYATLAMLAVRDRCHRDDSRHDRRGRRVRARRQHAGDADDVRSKIDAVERQMAPA